MRTIVLSAIAIIASYGALLFSLFILLGMQDSAEHMSREARITIESCAPPSMDTLLLPTVAPSPAG